MKYYPFLLLLLTSFTGCVTEYIPHLNEDDELLVVEGMITDQPEENYIRIYKNYPLWSKTFRSAVRNCEVWITDDLGRIYTLENRSEGLFVTDPATFTGVTGRIYTLHFTARKGNGIHNYESIPMEMIPVPPIDTMYYEKRNYGYNDLPREGCQIFFDSYDPSGKCNYYRWEYDETWEIRLPFYDVLNRVCWPSEKSSEILLKNTALFNESKVTRYPLKIITDPVEKLTVKYSILLTQYSLNEEEYNYWERLNNSINQVGGLYDITPTTITGNIFCQEDKMEKVLGYFSVCATTSRRLLIKDNFKGWNGLYENCVTDTVIYNIFNDCWYRIRYPDIILDSISPDLWNFGWWTLYEFPDSVPPMRIVTNKRYCGDCTVKGTNVRPPFWDDDN